MVGLLVRSLMGYRFVIVIAVAMTFAQVGATILLAFPLKIILDKIINHNDPWVLLNGPISFFDQFGTKQGLQATEVHTVVGVILFSASAIIVLGVISAILFYIELYLAAFIGQNLTARLRKQPFEQLERQSLYWHGKQSKGALVQHNPRNTAEIE